MGKRGCSRNVGEDDITLVKVWWCVALSETSIGQMWMRRSVETHTLGRQRQTHPTIRL